ncbi:protein Sst2p [[Candida] jaroonii]|uniref:Protein Sst2p n=1 Tax=[Candida] jaroonii TaxID=467808 RepID=A0ACA9Y7Z8_9ASCO|nr:protein Sst2p [[Candida] jaroonii]
MIENTSVLSDECSQSSGKTLCQTINKTFDKTPSGRIMEENIKDIYSLLILNVTSNSQEKWFFIAKQPPYSFIYDDGLKILKNINYDIETSLSTVSLSYQFSQKTAEGLLQKFYESKLLHSPLDRTRDKIKQGIFLQPTPKGVAILCNFINKNGIKFKVVPPIITSNLNSMELFCFERNFLNDKIVYSDYLIKILFIKMFGRKPNVWSPNNKQETFKVNVANLHNLTSENVSSVNNIKDTVQTSPLYHRYFTNPGSDAHVQYYLSSGVRLFEDKTIGTQSKYVVSGKAIGQWLMDCTDILTAKTAVEIGNLFIESGLLLSADQQPFSMNYNHFFHLSERAKTLVFWYRNKSKKIRVNDPKQSKSPELKSFLTDPGLRYLFKVHSNNEFCCENIDAYNQLKLHTKKVKFLNKLIDYVEKHHLNKSPDYHKKFKTQIIKLSNDCLSLAYHIYFTYLSLDASFVLNIDYSLRKKVSTLLIDNKTFCSQSDVFEQKYFTKECNELNGSMLDATDEGFYIPLQDDDCSIFSGNNTNTVVVEDIPTNPSSPRDEQFNGVYQTIVDFAPLVNELMMFIYRMMEVDSFSKFLESQIYRDFQIILESNSEN